MPVAAVILPESVSHAAVDDPGNEDEPQDLGGLLKVMIKKLNQNEKGQKELT